MDTFADVALEDKLEDDKLVDEDDNGEKEEDDICELEDDNDVEVSEDWLVAVVLVVDVDDVVTEVRVAM